MTQAEYLSWVEFYRLYPFDDLHRYHRPAALVSRSLGGGDMQELINWLQPDASTAELNDADMRTLRAFGFSKRAG